MTRVDKLGDPFEKSYPKENVSRRVIIHKKCTESIPIHFGGTFEQRPAALSKLCINFRRFIYINSWQENKHESVVMRKLFLNSEKGITIRPTFGRVRDCFGCETHDIFIGKLQHVDYSGTVISEHNFFHPLLPKKKSFKHEKELRAVIFEFATEPPFIPPFVDEIPISVDLDISSDKIRLAHPRPRWLL